MTRAILLVHRGGRRQWILALAMTAVTSLAVLSGAPAPAGADPGEPKLKAAKEHKQEGSKEFRIATVSTRNDMVSGGDVLVRIDATPRVRLDRVVVELNGADVTGAFQMDPARRSLLGQVTGLRLGDNRLVAREAGPKGPRAALRITNHPVTGPVISGPHEQPFFCATDIFTLPVIGGTLGPALDADCSAPTRVYYVYRTTGGALRPLDPAAPPPADIASITTSVGRVVRYIVRIETGTINRAIYQTAILHDVFTEPTPSPWSHAAGWNGRLIYTHGGGCRSGWYFQGDGTGTLLDNFMLSQGYGIATASLNVFGNNCNDLLASETTMMVKERFVEAYGAPLFTIAWGSSGGSYQSHQTGDNYPGLFDGLIVGHSFPDVTSATIFTLADSRLLEHYFMTTAPGLFTLDQQLAVSGFGQWANIPLMSVGAQRIDPDAEFDAAVPVDARYDAVTNPGGARGTVYDHTINVYGRDKKTGFARRPLDNVGVQYGLAALNAGAITKEQFLLLNEHIGGLDIDANQVPERMVADRHATRNAYLSGRILNGGGGLASTPIFDTRGYDDDDPTGDIHMRVHGFSTRERLIKANGHADNHVMWVANRPLGHLSTSSAVIRDAIVLMDAWLTNVVGDTSDDPLALKVVRAKPPAVVDACFTATGDKIVEPQTYSGGFCNTLFPSFSTPRHVAGAPLANDVVQCRRKPIDPADYAVSFTPAERARLERIFPRGVCDWSKAGVEQRGLKGTWLRVE